ncbi:MAG: hypothetical protein ACRCWJ_04065, partial [Casimicrobium sp.]
MSRVQNNPNLATVNQAQLSQLQRSGRMVPNGAAGAGANGGVGASGTNSAAGLSAGANRAASKGDAKSYPDRVSFDIGGPVAQNRFERFAEGVAEKLTGKDLSFTHAEYSLTREFAMEIGIPMSA